MGFQKLHETGTFTHPIGLENGRFSPKLQSTTAKVAKGECRKVAEDKCWKVVKAAEGEYWDSSRRVPDTM